MGGRGIGHDLRKDSKGRHRARTRLGRGHRRRRRGHEIATEATETATEIGRRGESGTGMATRRGIVTAAATGMLNIPATSTWKS